MRERMAYGRWRLVIWIDKKGKEYPRLFLDKNDKCIVCFKLTKKEYKTLRKE